MQLILNSEADIDIQRKMSAIEQEPFGEKFISKNLAEKVDDEIPNINEDVVEENISEELKSNEDTSNESENISSELLNESSSKDDTENTCVTDLPEECDDQKKNYDVNSDSKIEDEVLENSDSIDKDKIVEENNEEETDIPIREKEENVNEPEKQEKITTDIAENTVEIVETVLEETDDVLDKQVPSEAESNDKKEVIDNSVLDREVINISDDKEEDCITLIDRGVIEVEEKTTTLSDSNSESNIIVQPTDNGPDGAQNNQEIIIQDDVNDEPVVTGNPCTEISNTENNELNQHEEIIKDTNVCSGNVNEQQDTGNTSTTNDINETKKLPLICKLSNTLDILSDEEEEPAEKESQSEQSNSDEKQCIQIEDDDDIMLIDEETNVNDVENNSEDSVESKSDVKESNDLPIVELLDTEPMDNAETSNVNQDIATTAASEKTNEEETPVENKPSQEKLLPVNFLKTCKKNLADMTRDELEEFCILKIVESVVDRSNLNEIKLQLKTLAQTIDDYKKKAMLITKQNRDLQVVLKSIQEEQKTKTDAPITPLKITRSVGMQVLMTDKMANRRKSAFTPISISSNNNRNKNLSNQNPKSLKTPNNANQIPVPRLVPAVNNGSNKLQPLTTISPAKSPLTTTLPNGLRSSTTKPEKRPHSKMQQGNSVTVDLTDDEPPSKVLQRNANPPVRLVSPQNLLAPQRQPFGTNISSPRKVYIPISGSQNQVRPGQTIMLKPIAPQGHRQRVQAILPKPNNAVRMTRFTKHPAPLPDCMKQYQPPNWKALPPAPDLKLSKVENGIVISWKIDGYEEDNQEKIASYQLYAYQETSSPPSTSLWKKIGDVKALPLPMACTLTQFMAGYKYYFAVRAVDIRSRLGPFSAPGSILLLNKV